MPLRPAGWAVAVTAVTALVAGRVLALAELFVVGAVLALLVATCVASTAIAPLDLSVRRWLRPPRVHVGDDCVVEVVVTNRGHRRTRPLRLRDAVARTVGADVLLAPIEPGGTARIRYRIPTERRGHLEIGPLLVEVGDPFGLSAAEIVGAGTTVATVLPAVEPVTAPPRAGPGDPAGAPSPGLRLTGSDFHSLRPFVAGDDLRRVHWRTTARRDELTVMQHERREQGRTTVTLDVSGEAGPAFERSVSVAASLLMAAARRGDELRLATTADATEPDFESADDGLRRMLDQLAVVSPAAPAPGHRPIGPSDGMSVAVSTEGGHLRPPPPTITILVADDEAPAPAVDAHHIRIGRSQPLAAPWRAVLGAHDEAVA